LLSFSKKPKQRSAENPNSSLSNPDNWFVDFITQGAGRNKVNDKQSLGIPALYAAISRRAKTIASLSWDVYQSTDLGAVKAPKHPLHYIISKQPHPLHNSFTFRQAIITHLDLYGNAYAEIIRDGAGRPSSFQIHHPKVVEDIQKVVSGSETSYFYIVNEEEFGQIKRRAIPVADMIHVKGLSIDTYFGISPVAAHNEMLAAGVAATEYENNFFQNNAHIAYAIEMPMQVSLAARQNIENAWKRFWGGVKNAFTKPFILDAGSKLHKVSLSPQEAMLTDAKKNTVVDISRITDVPPHMLGAGENFTFSSVEVMVNDFVMYSIRNTIKQLESEFNLKCFTPSEVRNETYFTRFNIDSLLRGDTATRSKKMETEVKWGVITKNEAREMMGYNKLQDGDTFLTPLNMTTLAESEQQA
jgi:HK97 family phage portal protein